ncbi:MAG: response regulator transcription factor [Chloroflexi bacterium]|nr:response regulator transcription factor [Chloroflexota bacterium]
MTKLELPDMLPRGSQLKVMVDSIANPIRVVLVDSRTLVRAGFSALLERFPSISIVGALGSVEEALKLLPTKHPDIILFNPNSANGLGLEAIPKLVAGSPRSRLVLIASSANPELYEQAVGFGAMGVVHESQSTEILVKAIEKVNCGEVWLDRATVATLLGKMTHRHNHGEELDPEARKIARLGAREREIIALAGKGLRNKEIGERLSISEVTVRHHFTTIFSKLEVEDRLELLIFAYRHRLAELPQ